MNPWSHYVLLIAPIEQREMAKRISRSLDPDTGGYDAFNVLLGPDEFNLATATHAVYGVLCRAEFAQAVSVFLSDANTLKNALDQDYAVRWQEQTPPSLIECQAFIEAIEVHVNQPYDDVIAATGLKIIVQ